MKNNTTTPKKRVIFDCDDTLWGLNEVISSNARVPFEKIVTFNANHNSLITETERRHMTQQYQNADVFYQTKFYPGAERILDLNADVYINSHAFSEEMLRIKRQRLLSELKFPEDHLILTLIGSADDKKEIPDDTYIFVDDAPKNIAESPAHYNLMMRKPWNKDMSAIQRKYIEKYDTLNKIIDRIIVLLKDNL